MKKLVISGSAKFEKEIKKWVEYFKEHNYDVIKYPRKIDQSNELIYKDVYINFYKALEEADYFICIKRRKKWHKRICWSTSLCRNELYNSTKYITA